MTRTIAILLACALVAPAGAAQPDLNMDDLRTFSRRFCLKTDRCAQPLHPSIEDRRTDDRTLWAPAVPYASQRLPEVPVNPDDRQPIDRIFTLPKHLTEPTFKR